MKLIIVCIFLFLVACNLKVDWERFQKTEPVVCKEEKPPQPKADASILDLEE